MISVTFVHQLKFLAMSDLEGHIVSVGVYSLFDHLTLTSTGCDQFCAFVLCHVGHLRLCPFFVL